VADPAADPLDLLAWSSAVEGARVTWVCPSCARDHVRSIEAKLDVAHW
jgi:hypothetical protein